VGQFSRSPALARLIGSAFAVALLLVATLGALAWTGHTPITFEDADLEKAVRVSADRMIGPLRPRDLALVTSLDIPADAHMRGIEACTGLTSIRDQRGACYPVLPESWSPELQGQGKLADYSERAIRLWHDRPRAPEPPSFVPLQKLPLVELDLYMEPEAMNTSLLPIAAIPTLRFLSISSGEVTAQQLQDLNASTSIEDLYIWHLAAAPLMYSSVHAIPRLSIQR